MMLTVHRKKTSRAILACLLGVFVLGAVAFGIVTYAADVRAHDPGYFDRYLHNAGYQHALGVSALWNREAFIDICGEPSAIDMAYDVENDRTIVVYHYPDNGLELRCCCIGDRTQEDLAQLDADLHLVAIHILGDAYRFGDRQIGVGSTRSEIHNAYAPALPNTSHLEDSVYYSEVEESYRGDGTLRILFCYDEADVAERMILVP